jgi:hypothetical protein
VRGALDGEKGQNRIGWRDKRMDAVDQIMRQQRCSESEAKEIACNMQQLAGYTGGAHRVS